MSIVELILRGKKDLAGADLRGYDLHGVDLTNADLRNANLESADLRSAILKNANLSGANLENAYLKNSNFQNADLSGVRMRGAHLYRANLTGVRGLTLDCIGVANTAYNSIFDAELLEQVKKIYPTKLSDPGWEWQASVFTENTVIPKEQRVSAKQFH
jgi:uncharacterized protein YjbI with pentapeptide repeats